MTAKSKEVTAATYEAAGKRLAQAEQSRDKQINAAQDGLLTAARKEYSALKIGQHQDRIAPVVAEWVKAAGVPDSAQNRASRKLLIEAAPFIPRVRKAADGLDGHRMRNIRTGLTFCRKQVNDGKDAPSEDAVRKYLKKTTKPKGGNKSGLTGLSKDGEWSKHFGKNPTGMQQTAAFAFDKIAALIADEGVDDDDRAALKDALDVITSYNWSKTK
jgi:hypothetical protein